MALNRARAMASQKLLQMNVIPYNYEEALAAQVAHKHFQQTIEVTAAVFQSRGLTLFVYCDDQLFFLSLTF
uniref:Uncharacterized protein n=1 Tax=Parascaris equorum TaxID=6256 RepID=A0A914RK34_PAREQ